MKDEEKHNYESLDFLNSDPGTLREEVTGGLGLSDLDVESNKKPKDLESETKNIGQ